MRSKLSFSVLALSTLVVAPMILAQQQPPAQVISARAQDGMSVKNGPGDNAETLGTVEDMLVNLRDGKIVYYAVGHGRTLGIGGKTFAVAPEAITPSPNRDFYVLSGFTNADLDNMQGIDTNSWPKEADKKLSKGAPPQPPVIAAKVGDAKLARLDSLLGTAVRTPDNKSIGKIYDFALRGNNQIAYVVVSHGATLGVGGKLYAVPLDKFQLGSPTLTANQRVFVIHTTVEQFGQAPSFATNDAWPADADRNFWSKIKHGEAN